MKGLCCHQNIIIASYAERWSRIKKKHNVRQHILEDCIHVIGDLDQTWQERKDVKILLSYPFQIYDKLTISVTYTLQLYLAIVNLRLSNLFRRRLLVYVFIITSHIKRSYNNQLW